MNPFLFNRIGSIMLASLLLFLGSCSKSPQPNPAIKVTEDGALMSARNIEVLFSDSGKVEARLTSPLMNRYAGEAPYLEFPNGFKIYLFDSIQQITSTIVGNRGIRRENTHIMETWGNVIVRNEKKNEQLNTEHLVWDERQHRIWTDVKVKIIRPDQILYGTRMESNESFTRYSIQGVTGEMAVKSDSI